MAPTRLVRGISLASSIAVLVGASAPADGFDPASPAAARKLGYVAMEPCQVTRLYVGLREAREGLSGAPGALIGLVVGALPVKQPKLVEALERYLEVQRLETNGDARVQQRATADEIINSSNLGFSWFRRGYGKHLTLQMKMGLS